MEAAEVAPGQPVRILASEREVTRLGESVFRSGSVSEEALKATCAVLARMCGVYRRLDVVGVRAVATSAIRDSRNQREFVARASEAAGAPVEIISGREEARLIHLGVESNWPQAGKRILILDIGGGSAEIIVERRRPAARSVFQAAGRRPPARDFPQGRSARPAPAPPDAGVHSGKAGQSVGAAGAHRLGSRDRHIRHGFGGGQRGGAGPALQTRRDRPAARLHLAGAPPLRENRGAEPGGPARGHRHRAAARRNHRARSCGSAGVPGRIPAARLLLLARRRARRDHRRPGGAQRGRRAFPSRPRPAPRGGGDEPALRRVARARAQSGRDLQPAVHRPPAPAPVCRRPAANSWRRRPICTMWGISFRTSATTSIRITWWPTRTWPASPSASES